MGLEVFNVGSGMYGALRQPIAGNYGTGATRVCQHRLPPGFSRCHAGAGEKLIRHGQIPRMGREVRAWPFTESGDTVQYIAASCEVANESQAIDKQIKFLIACS